MLKELIYRAIKCFHLKLVYHQWLQKNHASPNHVVIRGSPRAAPLPHKAIVLWIRLCPFIRRVDHEVVFLIQLEPIGENRLRHNVRCEVKQDVSNAHQHASPNACKLHLSSPSIGQLVNCYVNTVG